MSKISVRTILTVAAGAAVVCALFQSWDSIVSFLGILLTAIIPLILGFAIAYVVSIPCNFLERHFFPNSNSRVVTAIRKPICLAFTVIAIVSGMVLSSLVLIPALIDTVTIVQRHGQQFIETTVQLPLFKPIRQPVLEFLKGDLFQSLKNLDIAAMADTLFGGSMGSFTTQVLTVVSTIMTGFFGMLFSFILLTDNTGAVNKLKGAVAEYLGPKRSKRFGTVIRVADSSFHSFIVRQFLEGAILGTVGTLVLMLTIQDPSYSLGVGVLMFLAALVPIVGYPVGLVLCAFMIVINDVFAAVVFILCVVVAQVLESGLLQPRIGDRKTVLPPVWITVGVTIGGGIAGFLGMLLAIPIASTIYQLVHLDLERRRRKRLQSETENPDESDAEPSESAASHMREVELTEGLEDNDGNGVGEVE